MDVLVINSYAGSLVLGAKAAGLPIRGSYEDAGFGIAAQKLNFPELKYVDQLPWPEDDLADTVVIAHPPCAPFSIMNPHKGSAKHTGTTADGFECHRRVMDYALMQDCKALTIESVPGVLKAAGEYEAYAKKYGYNHFFIKLNSISFGVPQWRPRVWIVFTKDIGFGVNFTPTYKPLSSIIQAEGTTVDDGQHIMIRKLKEAGVPAEELRNIFSGEYGDGTLLQIGQKVLGLDDAGENFSEVRKAWKLGGLYAAMMPRVLDPTRWAPTVLGGSCWFLNGRPLFLEEFNAIMGFPTDYKWPESFNDPRLYLSKGVCPQVATWILQQVIGAEYLLEDLQKEAASHWITSGQVLDLNPKKSEVEDALDGKQRDPLLKKTRGRKKQLVQIEEPVVRVRRSSQEHLQAFLDSLK